MTVPAPTAARRIRRDAVTVALRSRQYRLALTLAVMPRGYSVAKSRTHRLPFTGADITANEGDFV